MNPSSMDDEFLRRLAEVEGRIRAACDRAGRRREEVRLLAVTKTLPDRLLQLLPESASPGLARTGRRSSGARRPCSSLARVRWHLIGHLQRTRSSAPCLSFN